MRVLITGAFGQLGQELMRVYADAQVLGVDVVEMDITDAPRTRRMVADWRPDLVIHAAALTNVDGCEADPDLAFKVNALGTRNVALGAQACDAAMVYLSTDFVFDGQKVGTPYTEFDRPNPLSVYGQSKLAGEEYVRELVDRHFITRTAWLFGPFGKNFIRTILQQALKGKELTVVDDQVGSPTYARDLAEGIRRVAASGLYGTYHLTNAGTCSWYQLAKQSLARAKARFPQLERVRLRPITTQQLSRPAPRPAYSVLRNYNLELSGLTLLRHYEEALDEYLGIIELE